MGVHAGAVGPARGRPGGRARASDPGPASAADDDALPDGLAERWPDLARQVADVIASGGREIAGTLSVYVHAVVRSMGTHYGALEHTSNGGEEFRRRFLPGPAADRFGRRPARPHPARWPVATSAPCGRSKFAAARDSWSAGEGSLTRH